MKQFRFLLLAGLLACAGTASAQLDGRSEGATVAQRQVEDFGLITSGRPTSTALSDVQNLSRVVQQGNGNRAVTDQRNPGSIANQAFIAQVGLANEATLVQQGSGNLTTLNQQGQGNQATSKVRGNDNTTTLSQQGNDNRFVRDVATDQTSFKLTQLGNNNQLQQSGAESLAPPRYEVEMRGNGIQLSIQNGRIGQ